MKRGEHRVHLACTLSGRTSHARALANSV